MYWYFIHHASCIKPVSLKFQGLKLLQKAKRNKLEVVGRRPKGRPFTISKKVFSRGLGSDGDEEEEEREMDEMAELEQKIK